ncbi:hypothetical protein D3C78_1763450 [compost metagenome]
MIGQIELMKITQIEAGPAASNTSRPIGSQASGETGRSRLMIGESMLARKAKRPMAKPSGIPISAARPKPRPTRPRECRIFQPIPMSFGPLS